MSQLWKTRQQEQTLRKLKIFAACFLLGSPLLILNRFLGPSEASWDPALFHSLEWLSAHSPPTPQDRNTPPEDLRKRNYNLTAGTSDTIVRWYGVLSDGDMGLLIPTIAQRPTVSANIHTLQNQILDSCRFFLTSKEEEGRELLKKYRVRYVVVRDILQTGTFQSCARALSTPMSDFAQVTGTEVYFSARFLFSLYARLFYDTGKFTRTPLPRFLKQVYHSPATSQTDWGETPKVRIYEYTGG